MEFTVFYIVGLKGGGASGKCRFHARLTEACLNYEDMAVDMFWRWFGTSGRADTRGAIIVGVVPGIREPS